MRKADYLILTAKLKADILKWHPSDIAEPGEDQWQYEGRKSDHLQAVSLAKYLAEHLSVNKDEFLKLCGL